MGLDLSDDVVTLTQVLVDVESVSRNERELADLVEEALRRLDAPRGHPDSAIPSSRGPTSASASGS